MTKDKLKDSFLKPKTVLGEERRRRSVSKVEAAKWLGLDQNTYAKKENGEYPFKDYEMVVLSDKLGVDIQVLFFNN